LKEKGWKVIRIWEYDIKKNFDKCVKRILKALTSR
jgi:very-short-patch-repair endonuclease